MTVTLVHTKLHKAFTPLVTALAPWKGLTVLRALAEVCRTLCYRGGCTLVSTDPRDPLPSCHNPPDAAVIHFNSALPTFTECLMVYVMEHLRFWLQGTPRNPEIHSHSPGFLRSRDTKAWAPSPCVRAAADSGNAKHG